MPAGVVDFAAWRAELAQRRAYLRYADLRDRILQMLQAPSSDIERPSAYWSEELEEFAYLLDASPIVVDQLRHHCHLVTGVRAYEYRTGSRERERWMRRKLDALLEVGRTDLFVPESQVLGGFGFEAPPGLFNLDTLKYFEALIALDRAGLVAAVRDAATDGVIWEIGGGWGGFAYQAKRVIPEATYVITDLPQLLVLSGTYLGEALDVEVVLHDGTVPVEAHLGRGAVVLVPAHLGSGGLERVDLGVNMVSFQEMTTGQVEAYLDEAAHCCGAFYSLNRQRSLYNRELTSVRHAIEQRFDTTRVDVLAVSYPHPLPSTGVVDRLARIVRSRGVAGNDYEHLVGRTRRPR